MKLHEQPRQALNLVSSYGNARLKVSGVEYAAPLVLAPQALVSAWISGIEALDLAALAPVWPLEPRIVLLGSDRPPGERLRALRGEFSRRGIGLEVMDLGAACRTWNVLAQEDRAVVALLFP